MNLTIGLLLAAFQIFVADVEAAKLSKSAKINAAQLQLTIKVGLDNIKKLPTYRRESNNQVILGAYEDLGRDGAKAGYWNLPSRLGLHYSSQYYLIMKWLNRDSVFSVVDSNHGKARIQVLKEKILRDRLPDGSWYAIKDLNITTTTGGGSHPSGNLDATIFHYWALKVMKGDSRNSSDNDLSDAQMAKTAQFIKDKGGIGASVLFTKIILAIFGNYDWEKIPKIPLVLFYDAPRKLIVNDFSQWVIPHVKPMAYIIHYELTKNLGPDFSLTELQSAAEEVPLDFGPILEIGERVKALVAEIHRQSEARTAPGGAGWLNMVGKNNLLKGYSNDLAERALELKNKLVIFKRLSQIGQQIAETANGARKKLLDHQRWVTFLASIMDQSDILDRATGASTKNLVENLLLKDQAQKKQGSWGAYTLATLFTTIVLDDYKRADKGFKINVAVTEIQRQQNKGFNFIETLYFNSPISNYYGVLDDGSYWDTALLTRALVENGESSSSLKGVNLFLRKLQQNNGGFPFGYDFEDYPDVDDSIEILKALSYFDGNQNIIIKGLGYLEDMQNHNGGWAAFDRNNIANPFLALGAAETADSADLFDESSPDCTGHVLGFLATLGYDSQNKGVQHGIEYLKDVRGKATQSKAKVAGLWDSRWAINFLFGTDSALTGLKSLGVAVDDSPIEKWLQQLRNDDGGFGESSASYEDAHKIKGVSTASQTAWALSILSHMDLKRNISLAKGALSFLMGQIEKDDAFTDPSVTGTGHPSVIYMEYPSYPMAFPLLAIAQYLRKVCNTGDGDLKSLLFAESANSIKSLCGNYSQETLTYLPQSQDKLPKFERANEGDLKKRVWSLVKEAIELFK